MFTWGHRGPEKGRDSAEVPRSGGWDLHRNLGLQWGWGGLWEPFLSVRREDVTEPGAGSWRQAASGPRLGSEG